MSSLFFAKLWNSKIYFHFLPKLSKQQKNLFYGKADKFLPIFWQTRERAKFHSICWQSCETVKLISIFFCKIVKQSSLFLLFAKVVKQHNVLAKKRSTLLVLSISLKQTPCVLNQILHRAKWGSGHLSHQISKLDPISDNGENFSSLWLFLIILSGGKKLQGGFLNLAIIIKAYLHNIAINIWFIGTRAIN